MNKYTITYRLFVFIEDYIIIQFGKDILIPLLLKWTCLKRLWYLIVLYLKPSIIKAKYL